MWMSLFTCVCIITWGCTLVLDGIHYCVVYVHYYWGMYIIIWSCIIISTCIIWGCALLNTLFIVVHCFFYYLILGYALLHKSVHCYEGVYYFGHEGCALLRGVRCYISRLLNMTFVHYILSLSLSLSLWM